MVLLKGEVSPSSPTQLLDFAFVLDRNQVHRELVKRVAENISDSLDF